jgi:hypothetical protein
VIRDGAAKAVVRPIGSTFIEEEGPHTADAVLSCESPTRIAVGLVLSAEQADRVSSAAVAPTAQARLNIKTSNLHKGVVLRRLSRHRESILTEAP